jgi:FG-GAP repeat protein
MHAAAGSALALAVAGALLLGGCSVKIEQPSSVPSIDVYTYAEFQGFDQDYAVSMARADVTGDGKDELLIGAPAGELGLDGLVLVCTLPDLEVLGALFPWQVGQDPGERHPDFGRSLRVDDFDRDGWNDVAVGDPGAEVDGAARAGTVWYFHGPLDARYVTRIDAEQPAAEACFGATLASGDFDGDGWPDLAVAAPGGAAGGTDGVSVTVLYGPDLGRCLTRASDDGGNPFGAALAALPPADGASLQPLLAGAPQAWDGDRAAGSAFAWTGDHEPLQLAPSDLSDGRFGAALELGDFSGGGALELAVLAPQSTGALYLYDAQSLAAPRRIVLPAEFAGRSGAPIKLMPDVSHDRADELVLLSASRDEAAGLLFSPGNGAAHLRFDFAAADVVLAELDGDDEEELLLSTPTSFKPTGGYSLLRIVDFSWQPTVNAAARAPATPITLGGAGAPQPFTSR